MPFKILKILEKTNYGNKFTVEKLLVQAENGTEAEMYMRSSADYAIVIALVKPDEVVMVQQHRLGLEKVSTEFPMGQVASKQGQEIAEAELKEETGYTAGKMTFLGAFHPSPGWNTQRALVYVAEDLIPGEAEPEPLEFLTIKTMKLKEIDEAIKKNDIFDLPTIAAYHVFKLKFANKTKVAEKKR